LNGQLRRRVNERIGIGKSVFLRRLHLHAPSLMTSFPNTAPKPREGSNPVTSLVALNSMCSTTTLRDNNSAIHRHETNAVLVELLATSLRRGHWRVAIRRFLMLVACGVDVPEADKAACEALLSTCPERDLRRISDGVHSWVDMLHPRPEHWPPNAAVMDQFAHLYALSRPASSLDNPTPVPLSEPE
jgi:hypothetical protein